MTNAQIVSFSINEWVKPIIAAAMEGFAGKNQFTFILSNLVSPDRLMKSVEEHLSVPIIHKYISKLPDESVQPFVLDLIDGMISTRLEQGPIAIPMIGVQLTPDAFKKLKRICEKNFKEYGENMDEPVETDEVDAKPVKKKPTSEPGE